MSNSKYLPARPVTARVKISKEAVFAILALSNVMVTMSSSNSSTRDLFGATAVRSEWVMTFVVSVKRWMV